MHGPTRAALLCLPGTSQVRVFQPHSAAQCSTPQGSKDRQGQSSSLRRGARDGHPWGGPRGGLAARGHCASSTSSSNSTSGSLSIAAGGPARLSWPLLGERAGLRRSRLHTCPRGQLFKGETPPGRGAPEAIATPPRRYAAASRLVPWRQTLLAPTSQRTIPRPSLPCPCALVPTCAARDMQSERTLSLEPSHHRLRVPRAPHACSASRCARST